MNQFQNLPAIYWVAVGVMATVMVFCIGVSVGWYWRKAWDERR